MRTPEDEELIAQESEEDAHLDRLHTMHITDELESLKQQAVARYYGNILRIINKGPNKT